jgi:hypothetical protein
MIRWFEFPPKLPISCNATTKSEQFKQRDYANAFKLRVLFSLRSIARSNSNSELCSFRVFVRHFARNSLSFFPKFWFRDCTIQFEFRAPYLQR